MVMRSMAAIRRQIRAEWRAIAEKAGTVACKLPTTDGRISIFGSGAKTKKGLKIRELVAVSYASPAGEAFGHDPRQPLPEGAKTLCPFATRTCRRTCLGIASGRMVMARVKNARKWKATLLLGGRALWRELADAETRALARRAARIGYSAAVRPDGTTDANEGPSLARRNPAVQVYDYTKSITKALAWAAGNYPANYHVTFSWSGENWADCLRALRAGVNVAAPFAAADASGFPESFQGFSVFDADETDARYLDNDNRGGIGQIGALSFKTAYKRSAALAEAAEFVIDSPAGLAQIEAAH